MIAVQASGHWQPLQIILFNETVLIEQLTLPSLGNICPSSREQNTSVGHQTWQAVLIKIPKSILVVLLKKV